MKKTLKQEVVKIIETNNGLSMDELVVYIVRTLGASKNEEEKIKKWVQDFFQKV